MGMANRISRSPIMVRVTMAPPSRYCETLPQAGTFQFAPKLDFVTGTGPHGVEIADLDGDGKLDLITTNYGGFATGTTVSVLRNTSAGGNISFAPKVDLVTGIGPLQAAVGDLDGDGQLDLAVTNFGDGGGSTVSVLRNTSTSGTVSFDAKVDFGTGAGPYGIAIADVDGDGKRDLAITNSGAHVSGDGNTVSVLRNTSTSGTVSFNAKRISPRGWDHAVLFSRISMATANPISPPLILVPVAVVTLSRSCATPARTGKFRLRQNRIWLPLQVPWELTAVTWMGMANRTWR